MSTSGFRARTAAIGRFFLFAAAELVRRSLCQLFQVEHIQTILDTAVDFIRDKTHLAGTEGDFIVDSTTKKLHVRVLRRRSPFSDGTIWQSVRLLIALP
jgi:aminopeptidase C